MVSKLVVTAAVASVPACAYPPLPACPTFSLQPDVCVAAFRDTVELSGTITVDTTMHQVTAAGAMTAPVAVTTTTIGAGSDAVEVDAIIAQDVRLTANTALRATGSRPFAILASGSVTLDAMASIDVGSGGAGARSDCANSAIPGTSHMNGAGGGGGGGFGASGGSGTIGNSDMVNATMPTPGGPGGASIPRPQGLLGGCPGAPGGMGKPPGGEAGEAGLGGGAVYIAAGRAIMLDTGAAIAAAGGGGHGGHWASGAGDGGGGGGGAGGMVWLDAPEVDWTGASIIANGGGGGEGSDSAGPGQDGCPGWTSTPRSGCPAGASTTGAPGGMNNQNDGADGGPGGSLDHPMGWMSNSFVTGGGGGGGGGVGFIHIIAMNMQSGTTSPAAN